MPLGRRSESGGAAEALEQELGREVGAVRPDEGVKLRVDLDLAEAFGVGEWLEHGTSELRGEVDLALGSIGEPQVERATGECANFEKPRRHGELLGFTIDGVEIWRPMLAVVHGDDDPQKAAELRQTSIVARGESGEPEGGGPLMASERSEMGRHSAPRSGMDSRVRWVPLRGGKREVQPVATPEVAKFYLPAAA